MEFMDILPSPEMGSWLSEEFEQDFCYGAKASTYQNPVFATPPGSWALYDLNNSSAWTEHTKNLNELCHLEPFPDVILQDNFYIGSDDLFGGLTAERSAEVYDDHKFYGLPAKTLSDSPIFELSPSSPESPQSQKLPTIKIKLKRVKRPKTSKYHRQSKENSKKLEFEVITLPTRIEQNEVQSKKEFHCQSDFPVVNDKLYSSIENKIFPIDEHLQLESFTNSPVISLCDAFDTGEADDFLDELLNSTEIVDSSEFKKDLADNIVELDSSPLSSCSFVPSPHFDYSDIEMSPSLESIDECLLSPSKEMFEFLEVGTSKPSKNLTKIRPKKKSDESRYLRKKEQNKQAALRYRMKKKQEDTSLSDTLQQEEEHQEKLKMEFSNLKQEIHIMKNLLREAFVVKKLVPENFFFKK